MEITEQAINCQNTHQNLHKPYYQAGSLKGKWIYFIEWTKNNYWSDLLVLGFH